MTTGSNELRERLALLARDVHYALVEDGLCDLHQPEEYNAMRETIRRVLTPERIAALARQEEGRKAVERVMDEGDGYWKPCSGCYESVEGYENTAFPYSDTFRCRPGGGCHECGGLGVVWEQMAFDVAESPTQPIAALAPAQEPAGGATPTPQAAGVSEANFNRAWTAFQVEHGSYKKPLSDEALKAGLVAALTAAGAAPEDASARTYRDAYEGAREDLLDWKGRALRAESRLRSLGWKGIDASEPPTPQAEGRVGEMTPERACYFLRRFKADEKMLGPNEQWALDFAIERCTPTPQAAGVSEDSVKRAAAAIANARAGRRGAPEIANVLSILPKKLLDEVMEDAHAALTAAGAAPEGLPFTDAVIDKMQDVMAVHGFTVPVRVISDAFRTTMYAATPNPGAQHGQEGRDG